MGNLFNGGKAFLRKMEKYKTISKQLKYFMT